MANFSECVTVLQLQNPFFGALVYKLKHIEDASISPPTLCTDSRSIIYHPEFMDKQSVEQGVFCIAHELMHCVYQHIPYVKHLYETGIGPDGKPLNRDKLARAIDYPINYGLVKANVGKPPAGINICYDERYTDEMTPAEIYCLLPDSSAQQPMDGHDVPPDDGEPGAITAAEVISAATAANAIRSGCVPEAVMRAVESLRKPAESPWAVLRAFTLSSLRGADRSDMRRLNRRLVHRGIGVPSTSGTRVGHVGVVLDVSGSIDDAVLQLFGGHMCSIITEGRPEKVSLLWTDTQVRRIDTLRSVQDIRECFRKGAPGGGGTDMTVGVAAAEGLKCDVIVVLTDGYTPFGEPSKTRTIWAITTAGLHSPHGRSINIC